LVEFAVQFGLDSRHTGGRCDYGINTWGAVASWRAGISPYGEKVLLEEAWCISAPSESDRVIFNLGKVVISQKGSEDIVDQEWIGNPCRCFLDDCAAHF